MNHFLSVQIVYRQGLVRHFLANKDILLDDFMNVVRNEGKIKAVRFLPNVDEAAAALLLREGAATKVEVRHG